MIVMHDINVMLVLCLAAHTLLQQRQSDREELEKREHLQMERKHAKVCLN